MRAILTAGFALLAAGCAQPSAAPLRAPVPTTEPTPVAVRRADTFVASYSASIAAETAQLRTVGLGPDWDAIRALVEVHLPPQDYPLGATGATHAIMRRLHIDSTTNFIVRIGYRAHHLAHPAQAGTIVRAANIRSWDDADALVLVSPTVFVADLVRIDRKPDNSADLVYRVREPIKSAPAVGVEFSYPLNGPFPTVVGKPGDPPPPPPPPNPAAWELASRKAVLFFRAGPGAIGNFFGPMPIEGDKVLPGYHSTTAETTLAGIRAAARAQLCSPGYVPVAQGIDLPHRC
jgi:hypothetical protein